MNNLRLEHVVVFSRHGIRTPLPNTLNFLAQATSKKWPKWPCTSGYLTTRGGVLESYFGDYLIHYLAHLGLSLSVDDIFIYANSMQRTVATGQYFSLGAFAGLDIKINHQYPIERMDAIFNPILRNNSAAFKTKIIDDLKLFTHSKQLIEQLDKTLTPAYQQLSDILDYKNSQLYQQYQCEFSQLPTHIELNQDQEPTVHGPLALATAFADAFTLQYYSAFTPQNIAWGGITNFSQWQMLTNIKNQYLRLLFQSPVLSKHVAQPLIQFIAKLCIEHQHKFNFLVGHDSNIVALLAALGFKHYQLPKQYEQAPIGGKVVFYRFYDKQTQQHYFKAEYIYQTFEQIHYGEPLSSTNPPMHFPLVFVDIAPNSQGLYLWQDFSKKLRDYLAEM